LSPTQFSAVFNYPDASATVDSGSTLNLIATVTGVGNSSPLCNASVAITATTVLDGVVTIYAVNDFVPGLQVTFTGLTLAAFLNNAQFEIINVDPNNQWFQVFYTTSLGVVPPNQVQTTDTGTATFNSVEIYRVSDGGGIYLFVGAVSNPIGTTILPYDSGINIATVGLDDGVPGTYTWANPGNVSSSSSYATVTVPTPSGGGGLTRFRRVQVCQNIVSIVSSLPTTLEATFPLSVTSGNTIIVGLLYHEASSAVITDSNGNTYSLITSVSQSSGDGPNVLAVYQATNVSGGPTTLKMSVVVTGNGYYGFNAQECSGLNGTVDVFNSNSSTAAPITSFSAGSITTVNANDALFSFIWMDLGKSSSNPAAIPVGISQVVFAANDNKDYQQLAAANSSTNLAGTVFNPMWTGVFGAPLTTQKAIGINVAFELMLFQPSDGLDAQTFDFTVPPNIAVSGIEIDFESTFTGAAGFGILDVQLLRAGNPVGVVMQVNPTATNENYTLGGINNLWGVTWGTTDFNSVTWGVRITAVQSPGGSNGTFSVRNVRARITGSTSTTGWVYNDFVPDADLDILQIAPQNHASDPPPGAPGSSINTVGTLTVYWQNRLWMVVGNYVYFDAGPDCENGIPEQAWPPSNRFQFSGPVLNLIPTADGVGLLVYLADRVNAILGGPETISFYPTDALSNFGISNPNAIFRDGSIIGQFTTQRQYFDLVDGRKDEIGEHISDYLTENFTAASTYVTMHRDGLDVGVFLSNGVDQVVRYGSNIGAWSVPAFPVGGAGALRSIETSVGVHTLMLASPTGGTSGATNSIVAGLGANSFDASGTTLFAVNFASVPAADPINPAFWSPDVLNLGNLQSTGTVAELDAATVSASGFGFAYWNGNMPGNGSIQITVGALATSNSSRLGVVYRAFISANRNEGSYTSYVQNGSLGSTWQLIAEPGTLNQTIDIPTINSGDVLEFRFIGDNHSLYQNGTLIGSITDSTYLAGGFQSAALAIVNISSVVFLLRTYSLTPSRLLLG